MNAILLLPLFFGITLFMYYTAVYLTNNKQNVLGLGLLAYIFIFAILANVFYYHPYFKDSIHYGTGHTYVSASIYFYIAYIILLFPFLKGNCSGFAEVKYSSKLNHFILLVALSSIIESFLLIPDAIYGLSHMETDMMGVREEANESGNIGSGITSIPVLIYSFFNTVLPMALFYNLSFGKRRWLLLLSLAIIVTPILNTMATGTRKFMVFPIIDTFVAYLIFFPYLSKKVKRVMNIVLLVIVSIIVIIAIWMSLLRFVDSRFDNSYWIVKYLGEGFVNFNTLLFDSYDQVIEPCYGDYNMPFFRQLLGLDYSGSHEIRREYWGLRLPFPTNIFYTIVGVMVIDWGKLGAIIFCILIAFFTYKFTKIKKGYIYFSQLILLHFVASMCAKGCFYFAYGSIFGGRTILYMLILCFILRFFLRT